MRPRPVTSHASLIVQVSFWANGTVCGLAASEADGVNCDSSTSSFSRRLRLMDSPARKELDTARLVFAMSSVNADVRGPQRTTARVDGYSASFGHQRCQIIFRCVVRGRDHENDWAPHLRRRQHMIVLQDERCKIDYGDRSAIPSEPPSLARLSAALASDGGGEGWPIPLVDPSIVRRLRNSNSARLSCDRGIIGSAPCSFPTSTRCRRRRAVGRRCAGRCASRGEVARARAESRARCRSWRSVR